MDVLLGQGGQCVPTEGFTLSYCLCVISGDHNPQSSVQQRSGTPGLPGKTALSLGSLVSPGLGSIWLLRWDAEL